MPALVYFDTDCFHHFASTFEHRPLSDDLRNRIVFSPMTMMEFFSHLARAWGDNVHRQIQGLRNWVAADHVPVLPWMEAAISHIGFGVVRKDDEYTKRLQADWDACARL